MPSTAPVPTTRKMMEKYIRVGIGREDGKFYWRGEMLSEFPKYGALSEEDGAEWRDWLETLPVEEFLDKAIIKCQQQAEINKDAGGHAVVSEIESSDTGHVLGNKLIDDPTRNSH